jgi:protease PrsW
MIDLRYTRGKTLVAIYMNEQNPTPNKDNGENNYNIQRVANKISDLTGVEKLEGFKLGEMFSEVFKKHSDKEVEEYFTVGTEKTTPAIENVETAWPKPWVFFRTLVGALVVYYCFVLAWKEFTNANIIPGLIIVGSFAVPFSVLIFFFEANVRKNISLYQIIRLVFFGGILSLIFSLILFRVSDSLGLSWLGASVAGLVEEPGKLIALIIVINIPKYRYILNGLLFGAAIGTGFAAFESAGYALRILLASGSTNAMLDIILLRGVLSPFSHIVWTGMSAAMLWKIKGSNEFNIEIIKDKRFLRVFGAAVLLHALWNSPIELPFNAKYIILGFIAWVIILGFIQDGLKQLLAEKNSINSQQTID